MNPVDWAGLLVFLVCAAVIAVELVFVASRLRRAGRAWDRCVLALQDEGGAVLRALEQLDQSTERNRLLLHPYRRVLRRLQSPALQALWQAYRAGAGRE